MSKLNLIIKKFLVTLAVYVRAIVNVEKIKQTRLTKKYWIPALMIIAVLGVYLSIKTVLGPGMYLDLMDDVYYLYFSHQITTHGFSNSIYANFLTKYILSGVQALLFRLFGISLFTEGLFSMICLIGTIICIFFIAKILDGTFAGLISACTFIFVPLIAAEGAASGDNMPVAFFATLAVLLILLGIRKKQIGYYALSGFIGLTGILGGSVLNFTVFMFLIPYLTYVFVKNRNKVQLIRSFAFLLGMVLAVAMIFTLGYLLQSNAMAYFITHFQNNGRPGTYISSSTPGIGAFLSLLLPLHDAYNNVSYPFFWPFVSEFGDFSKFSLNVYPNIIGFFGYAMIISIVFLVILSIKQKQYAALIPIAWFLLLSAYMSFGVDSLPFNGYMLFLPRFMIIVIPPLSIIIGIAISKGLNEIIKHKKGRKSIPLSSKALLMVIIFGYMLLIANAILLMGAIHQENGILTDGWSQISKAIAALPKNATIYIVSGLNKTDVIQPALNPDEFTSVYQSINTFNFLYWMIIESYANYKVNVNYSTIFDNCSSLTGNYIIGIYSVPYDNKVLSCTNLHVVFSPNLSQSETQFGNSYDMNNTNTAVLYKRNP